MGRARWVLVAVALLAVTVGCGTVPTGSPVRTGRAVQPTGAANDPYIRLIPAKPQPGWSPEKIVRGFLTASASFDDDHAVARSYLAPGKRASWEPKGRVAVYSGGAGFSAVTQHTSKSSVKVVITAPKVGSIDRKGQFVAAPQGKRIHEAFHVQRVGGQWRIETPPKDMLLTWRDVTRAYRTFNLYFFGPQGDVLVPNPVFVPVRSRANLATTLVRDLLRGPTDWLAPAVGTAFPSGTRLLDQVQIRAGTVTVNLNGTALSSSATQRAAMSAQLVWTLKQLPEMQRLRLEVAGEPLEVAGSSGEGALQGRGNWPAKNPAGITGTPPAYFTHGGRLRRMQDGRVSGVAGPVGSGQVALRHPAVSLDTGSVAGLTPSGHGVLVGKLRDGATMRRPLTGQGFTTPSWDRYGNLWVAGAADGSSRVWMLENGRQPVRVSAPELEDEKVLALRVARDGCRVAAVVADGEESRLMLGRVVRTGGQVRAEAFVPLAPKLEHVIDIAWRNADQLAVLGKGPRGALSPYLVHTDGTGVVATSSVGGMTSIAAAPNVPMLVEVEDDQVWRSRDNLSWQQLGDGSDPTYPG